MQLNKLLLGRRAANKAGTSCRLRFEYRNSDHRREVKPGGTSRVSAACRLDGGEDQACDTGYTGDDPGLDWDALPGDPKWIEGADPPRLELPTGAAGGFNYQTCWGMDEGDQCVRDGETTTGGYAYTTADTFSVTLQPVHLMFQGQVVDRLMFYARMARDYEIWLAASGAAQALVDEARLNAVRWSKYAM